MRYFIANLAVHLIILAALTVFACIFASRNRKRKTKHVISYFFPILFALVAIIDIVLYTAPRLLDINSMINSNYYYTTGTVEKIGFLKNYFIIDGNYYYLAADLDIINFLNAHEYDEKICLHRLWSCPRR